MKIMVLGDLHGNTAAGTFAITNAKAAGCEHIIQCGDFGLWPGLGGVRYLDALQRELEDSNIVLTWLDGNHEYHDLLDALVKFNPVNKYGQTYIRSNIVYSPRGCVWTMAGKRFMTVGGAVSVDRQWRRVGESWWWQEILTADQAGRIISSANAYRNADKAIDYLFTHDCSDRTPFRERLKPDIDSKENRRRIDKILDGARPRMHFHGHMHETYDWSNPVGDYSDDVWVQTYGLECDGMQDNWVILDTDDDSVVWKTDLS